MSPPHDESPTTPRLEADPKQGGLTRRAVIVGGVVGGVGILSAEIFAAEPAAAYTFGPNFEAPPGYCQPFTTPVPPIGSYYQEYRTCACTSPHVGTDYTGPTAKDRTICSIGPGHVSNKDYNGGMGNFIRIQHPNGVSSQYLHLKSPSPLAIGDPVFAGTAIGVVGMTGNAYAPHLHLETYFDGKLISPEVYLRNSPAAGAYPQPDPLEESTMACPVRVDSNHLFLVAPGFIKHFGHNQVVAGARIPSADLSRNVTTADDKWIDLNGVEFGELLDGFGIPRAKVSYGSTGAGVYDPNSDQIWANGMWSWAREAQRNTELIRQKVGA